MSEENQAGTRRAWTICCAGVMALAGIGYVVGLSDGVPISTGDDLLVASPEYAHAQQQSARAQGDADTIAAVSYREIAAASMGVRKNRVAQGVVLKSGDYDLFAEIVPSAEEKQASLLVRSSRRAFNGAPPIIPHGVDGTSDAACYACHQQGMQLGTMRANAMSHGFLANCTQCHAPPPPAGLQSQDVEVATDFKGLPAPSQGHRAFDGAPPTIPHSQWMRENCTACHGGPNGWAGLETTHPWRENCTQCHVPSAELDQAVVQNPVLFLPPPNVEVESQ